MLSVNSSVGDDTINISVGLITDESFSEIMVGRHIVLFVLIFRHVFAHYIISGAISFFADFVQ